MDAARVTTRHSHGGAPKFTSIFAWSGQNLSAGANARKEADRLRANAPAWVRKNSPIWILQHRLRQFLTGAYSHRPFQDELFTHDAPNQRVSIRGDYPSGRWLS